MIAPLRPGDLEEAAAVLGRACCGLRCRDSVRYGRDFDALAGPLLAEETVAGSTMGWCARRAGAIAGLAGLRDGDPPELRFLAVDPAARRCGIGSALLAHAQDAARGSDAILLRQWIDPDDPSAAAFLTRRGFVRRPPSDVLLVRPPAPVPDPGDPPEGYAVRSFHPDDVALWEGLQREIFPDCRAVRFEERYREGPGYAFEPEGFLFAFDGAEPVAMAAAVTAGPAVPDPPFTASKFDWVGVKPAHRRRGLARHLCLRLMRFLAARGRERVCLDTQLGRTGAIRFYETLGFSERFAGVVWFKGRRGA
ncbi:MAG: GNAT family N-acetyltransferase [Planctomycetes bacterium]|nr:GNAT family N-acetyltransferase [Planctomycetota bacterium]